MSKEKSPTKNIPGREWWIRKLKDVPGGQAFSTKVIAIDDGFHDCEEIVHVREVLDRSTETATQSERTESPPLVTDEVVN